MAGDGDGKTTKINFRALITRAFAKTGTGSQPIDFQPFGLLYGGYPKPDNHGQPSVQEIHKDNTEVDDKINLKLVIVVSEESPSHLAIKLRIPTPDTTSGELMVTIKLFKNNVNSRSYVIDSGHKDWASLMESPPYILTQTPGCKVTKGSVTFDMDWVCKNIKIFRLMWRDAHTIVAENLFINHNLPPQNSIRAIAALQGMFSSGDGYMDIFLRDERAKFSIEWAALRARFGEEAIQGNLFARFYTAQIRRSTKMFYIDSSTAIMAPASRPKARLGPLVVSSDLMEITTRLGVASLQTSEYESTLAQELYDTRPLLKLLRILGAGDIIYSGFLYFPDPPQKRLRAGDRLKISFEPGEEIEDECWSATVSPGHPCAKRGEVTLDIFRPLAPQPPDATKYERSHRKYVDLDVSKFTASPEFKTMADVQAALTRCAPAIVSAKLEFSTTTTSRIISGLCNMQHGGKQENRRDGTRLWVHSRAITALSQHVLFQDSRAATYTDFLGDKARACMSDLNAEDHTSVITYLSKVPTDKHGIAVGIIEGYPGVGKTFLIAQLVKALLNTQDDTKYLIAAPSNAAVDVAAKAIYDTLIQEALSDGEVVVRAHSAQVESEYIMQYATKLHREEVDKIIPSSEVEDGDTDVNSASTVISEAEPTAGVPVEPGKFMHDGSVDIDAYVQDCLVGIQLSQDVNVRLSVGEGLVRDRRFVLHKHSLGYWALSIAGLIPQKCKYTDTAKWAHLANLFRFYVEEGQLLDEESKTELKRLLEQLRAFTISKVRVVVGTPTNLCSPDIANIIQPDMLVIDDAGRLNRAEYLMIFGHLAATKVLVVGDSKQLQPVVSGPKPLTGFMPDLSMSVLEWYHHVNWPFATLFVQRRAYKGLMNVVSAFSYDKRIRDGPDAKSTKAHPVTFKVMSCMASEFPAFRQAAIPSYFFEMNSNKAMEVGSTKSWCNLETTSMAVHLIEKLVKKGGLFAEDIGIITTYQANADVCRYALKSLHESNTEYRFKDVFASTCDSIQGGQKALIIFLPVVTDRHGFVNDQHRLTVGISRASDALITIGNSNTLDSGKKNDYVRQLFEIARRFKQVVQIPIGHPYLQHPNVKLRV